MGNILSRTPEFRRNLLALCISLNCTGLVEAKEYVFDSSLLQGSSWGMDLEQFNRHQVAPGRYLVDVYVNNTLVKSVNPVWANRSCRPQN